MKKKNKIISLLTAAAMLPVFPLSGTANAGYYGDWNFDDPIYDENGDIYYKTVRCRTYGNEQVLPSEIKGIPVKAVDPFDFIKSWLHGHKGEEEVGELNVYLPEGMELYLRDIMTFSDDYMLFSCDWPKGFRANFILSDGSTYVYDTDFSDTGSRNFFLDEWSDYYEDEEEERTLSGVIPKDWDYDVLTDEDGSKYIKLTGYHGHKYDVNFPEELDGIPVKAVGEKLFGEKERMMSVELKIPDCITEFDDDCFYGLRAAMITYGLFRYALVNDIDPETPDYLVITGTDFYPKLRDFEEKFRNENPDPWGYSHEYIEDLFVEKLKEEYLQDGSWSDSTESMANYPVKGVALGHSYNVYNGYFLPFPDSVVYFRSNVLVSCNSSYIHFPKGLEIFPSNMIDYLVNRGIEYDGLENVRYIPRDLFSESYYDIEEIEDELVDPEKLLPEGVYVDDPFVGFHINDEEGRSFRIIMDKKDFNYYAHLIYMPSYVEDVPDEFMGFPVIDERTDTMYASSSQVTIPEDTKELSLGSFTFDPIDFPELRTELSSYAYPTYENAVRAKLKNAALSNIKAIDILSKDITIKAGLFFNGAINEISFPGDVIIEKAAFSNSAVADLSFKGSGSSVHLGENAFFRSPIVNLEFADDVNEITMEKNAMYGIQAKEIKLPAGTLSIGKDCFSSCSQLRKVTIEGSPTIGDSAFTSCPSLSEVTFTGKPKLGKEVFRNCKSLKVLNIDPDILAESDILLTCPNLTTINGEALFDKDGVPNPKYVGIIEKHMKEAEGNRIADQYVMYRVRKMISETVTDDMTDIQKVKALHDKLCSMVEYDTGNEDALKNHTDVSVFLNDKSVCEGYARAFDLLMQEIGIECCYVCNDSHAWNIINIGGHYFHIDATWDDGDVVEYSWFMKNDSEIKDDTSHITWGLKHPSDIHTSTITEVPVCTDTIGDVNSDGVVDAIDASAVLSSYARASAGDKPTADAVLGDVNFNGKVDAVDASEILTRYADASVE